MRRRARTEEAPEASGGEEAPARLQPLKREWDHLKPGNRPFAFFPNGQKLLIRPGGLAVHARNGHRRRSRWLGFRDPFRHPNVTGDQAPRAGVIRHVLRIVGPCPFRTVGQGKLLGLPFEGHRDPCRRNRTGQPFPDRGLDGQGLIRIAADRPDARRGQHPQPLPAFQMPHGHRGGAANLRTVRHPPGHVLLKRQGSRPGEFSVRRMKARLNLPGNRHRPSSGIPAFQGASGQPAAHGHSPGHEFHHTLRPLFPGHDPETARQGDRDLRPAHRSLETDRNLVQRQSHTAAVL